MAKKSTSPRDRSAEPERLSYWEGARKPLQILTFLAPLIIVFELALLLWTSEDSFSNEARDMLLRFFDVFGITPAVGLHLGGLSLVVVLLVWHVLARDPWRIDAGGVGLMVVESIALAVPLIVLCQLVNQIVGDAQFALTVPTQAREPWSGYDTPTRLLLSVGAGLYEELMFRMLLIAVVHTLLVDAAKIPNLPGAVVAVIVAAVAFTWYHQPVIAAGDRQLAHVAFYALAGVYFGALFLVRGFGIVVAVHAAYDMIVLTLLAPPAP
ncbi:MAG: CPBP family intramembrane metalloprotease [Phycisphaerales bacterium]|nr:MAG: CPBP family intramembrane metalloprotease [Phycisphaerales bacterium]